MHSHSGQQQRNFYYLLLGTLILHAGFMVTRFSEELFKPKPYAVNTTEAIKVTFLPETTNPAGSVAKKQIVQSEDSDSTEKPKDSAFLSDKDRSFDRQTIARNVDKFQRTAAGNAAVTKAAQKPIAAPKKASRDVKDLKLSDIGMQTGEVGIKQQVSRAPASESKKGIQNGDPMSQGFSATNDYVQEVGLGDFTHLNTVEFKFYGFYHRIRQKLEQFWGKSIQEKSHALFRSGRRIPAGEDLITSVRITMNTKGEIVGVKILGTSGVKELDDAAVESFNQAGPFPNPPKELLVDGKATIEWGFVVKS